MTLRESERSLLHNPLHAAPGPNSAPGAQKGMRHNHASKFIPLIAISAACLTATIWFALSAIGQFGQGFEQFAPQLSKISQDFESQLPYSPGAQNSIRDDHRNAQMHTDVIIEPLGSSIDERLKKLTANRNSNALNPFEIPANRVLDMLAASSDDNISLEPGMKFYPTNRANVIRACPGAVNAFDEVQPFNSGPNDSTCFTIKASPLQSPSTNDRRVL